MKKRRRFLWFAVALVSGFGLGAEINREKLSFELTKQLKPGQTTKEEVQKIFGSPSDVTERGKTSGVKSQEEIGELWEFNEGKSTRIEIFFPAKSNFLEFWIWHVPEKSPDQNLKTAMEHYASASWEPETVKWINPHSFPNECYFRDKKLGISLEYNRARKEVFTVTQYDPNRKVASEEDEKPPKYCIAIDPNVCTPAISAKEFFKETPISKYCEIPK